MTTKLRKQIILILLGLVIAMCGLFSLANNQFSAQAQICDVELAQELKTKYVVGESLQVPSAIISYKGSEYSAEKWKICFPSGRTITKSNLVLSEPGEYTLTYFKKLNGNLLQGEKKINVANSVYSVGESSTISYGANEKVANVEGLNVSLAYGDEFRYNVPLNLTGKVKADKIINFFALPKSQGSADANEVYVKLTDAYDEENYVIIKTWHADFTQSKGAGNAYQSAKSTNQKYTGIQVVSSSSLLYNGEYYNKRVETSTGYESNFSFTAAEGYGKRGYSLSMNYAEKEVYGCPQYNSYGGNLIVDLDNSLFFKEYWDGFTTGECYLSIYADSYNTTNFNFLITEILGEDLSNTDFENTAKPEIKVEKEDGLYAIVGQPFKLFNATALDIYSGVVDCDIEILYNGYAHVACDNGYFTPTRAGRYTISYKAKGLYGAESVERVTIRAVDESLLDVDFGALPQDIKSGKVALFDVPVVSGASGQYEIKLFATNLNDSKIVYELELQDDKYSLNALYSGEYKLTCEVVDANGVKTFERTINVQKGDYALKTQPKLPQYFLKNASYNLGEVSCYKLSSGIPEEKTAEIYYAFDDETQTKLNSAMLKVLADEQVKIFVYCENNLVYERAISVIDAGYGTYEMQMYKYFVSEDDSLVFDNSDLSYTYVGFDAKKQNSKMSFINDILVQDFTITFRVPECNFKTLKFKLDNGTESLLIKFTTNGISQSTLSFNDKVDYLCTNSFESGATYVLTYSNSNKTLTVNNKVYVISDDVFAGFNNVLAKLSFELDGVDTRYQSKLLVYKINNQVICAASSDDFIAPQLYNRIDTGLKTINQEIVLSNIKPIDVLAINSIGRITVTNPDNQYVTSQEGVLLKNVDIYGTYKIKLDMYGAYKITISFEDDLGNDDSQSFSIVVKDLIGPEISVDKAVQEIKLNAKISPRKFSVSDNLDSASEIITSITIIAPNGISYTYNEKQSLKAKLKGTYKVIIYAVDTSGNVSQANYDVVVK